LLETAMLERREIEGWWNEFERLSRALGQVGPDEVCCEGLTPRQTSILRTLVAQEGARLMDLASSSGISPSAMTRVVERLEKLGLVQRVRGQQQDGRAAMVKITPEGREARHRVDELMRRRTGEIVEALDDAEREIVLGALKKLTSAMEQHGCCALNRPDGLVKLGQKPATD
jgi:DNA-binding MarR family transcriptional regulator